MRWWLRFRLWLIRLLSPKARVMVVPGECDHSIPPDVMVERLTAATGNPKQFAAILATLANCAGCGAATLAQFAYDRAGDALVDQDDDGADVELYGCGHRVNHGIIARRLVLAYKAGDGDSLGRAFAGVYSCADCLTSVVLCLLSAHIPLLDAAGDWEPAFEQQTWALMGDV